MKRFFDDFWLTLWRHRKRGNVVIRPLGVIKSWRMAECARYIRKGCGKRYTPCYLRRSLSGEA